MLKFKENLKDNFLDEIIFREIMWFEDKTGKSLNEDEFFSRFMTLRSGAKALLEGFSDKYDHELDSEDLFKAYSYFYNDYSTNGKNRDAI